MYSEWASLSAQISANSCGAQCFSVLNKFPASAGREVVVSVVKQLGTNLGITQNAEPSHLVKDEEVGDRIVASKGEIIHILYYFLAKN